MERRYVDYTDLIKEFLGKGHAFCRTIAASDFEGSWEWIMPVYHKCVDSLDDVKENEAILDEFFPIGVFMDTKDLHDACVAFIKYYNRTHKKVA
jgi:hypothetical protein